MVVTTARPRIPRDSRARVFGWLRGSEHGLVALALLIGAGAGGGAVLFRYLILWITEAASGHRDYSTAGRVGNHFVAGLGPWFVLLTPVVGGLLYGPLVDRFAREARGHGVPEVMYAVARRGGRIAPKVAVVKSLASALCIGTGGSVGREGPIVQIGSALASTVGQVLRAGERRLRLLVACGAAGGISATFNAPLAGVFFALEVIIGEFAARSFGMVVLSSVVAAAIGRWAFGDRPFLALPTFDLASPVDYALFAVLGLLAGAAGVLFTRVLYAIEDVCDAAWRGPEWLRPAAGGVLLGLLLLALPEMYGVGYPVLETAVRGNYAVGFLIVLLLAKMVAVSLTIGIGGSGGVFAPSLFCGAMLGAAYGAGAAHLVGHSAGSAGAYAIVGMGAVFAGAARAPITGVLIIFELTGDYAIILPMMIAIALATGVSNLLTPSTIYTLKLRRRGIDLSTTAGTGPLADTSVASVMDGVPPSMPSSLPAPQAAEMLSAGAHEALPVIDANGAYTGVLTATDLERAIAAGDTTRTAGELAEPVHGLEPALPLDRAAAALADGDRPGLPVLDTDGTQVIGWLTGRHILTALARTDP